MGNPAQTSLDNNRLREKREDLTGRYLKGTEKVELWNKEVQLCDLYLLWNLSNGLMHQIGCSTAHPPDMPKSQITSMFWDCFDNRMCLHVLPQTSFSFRDDKHCFIKFPYNNT